MGSGGFWCWLMGGGIGRGRWVWSRRRRRWGVGFSFSFSFSFRCAFCVFALGNGVGEVGEGLFLWLLCDGSEGMENESRHRRGWWAWATVSFIIVVVSVEFCFGWVLDR